MSYTGNPALAPAIRERIVSTFKHTLELAEKGSRHEASLGCDFILQMDPQFGPARALQQRLAEGEGPVEVDDLRRGVTLEEPELGVEGLAAADLESLFRDTDETEAAADPGGLKIQIEERLDGRDFAGVMLLAEQNPGTVETHPELALLIETATARREAGPYVQRFLDSARDAASASDMKRATSMLEKARSLDPTHPGVRDLSSRLAARASAASPPPPPPMPAPESFAELAVAEEGEGEGAGRIAELLAEGQQAYEADDYQGAIDVWSRIFLIDIDHAEAGRRIDEARRLKAEQERRVEEIYHEAVERFEAGEPEEARRGIERVLELSPGHLAAREAMARLERLDSAAEPAAAAAVTALPMPKERSPLSAELDALELREEILVPPEPGSPGGRPSSVGGPAAAERPTMVAVKERRASRRFLAIGSGVAALAALTLAFLYLNRDQFFPNAAEPPAATEVDPIARATRLHGGGRAAMAINQLRRLPPSDPHYQEAQALISQWEAAGSAPAPGEAGVEAAEDSAESSAGDLARRAELLQQASAALAAGGRLEARDLLDRAAQLSPLTAEERPLEQRVEAAIAPIAAEVGLFLEGEYERLLPRLWRLHQTDSADADVLRMIVDSYYNMAVRHLQRGEVGAAAGKLGEALALVPGDAALRRHLRFAESYQARQQDLQYRIYVKYLPLR